MYFAHIILAIALIPQSPSPVAATPRIPPADCSAEPSSCSEFNQMLAANDPDFTDLQAKVRTTYVCFEQRECFTLSFDNPRERNDPKATSEEQDGLMLFQAFADGVERENKSLFFTWVLNETETHGSPWENEKNHSYIDDREVTFVFDFTNINKTTTRRTIKIRRSTLRFADTLLAPEAKSGSQYENLTGDCIIYPR